MDLEEILREKLKDRRLPIRVGERIHIEIDGVDGHHDSTMLGSVGASCLLISTPRRAGLGNHLYSGKFVAVRYMADGTLHGFQSEVLGLLREPYEITLLSYPMIVERHELRQSRRVRCTVPALLRLPEAKRRGVLLDLSRTGCRFALRQPADPEAAGPEKDTRAEILVRLKDPPEVLTFTGTVRSVQQEAERTVLGVEFEALDKDLVYWTVQYLDRVLKYAPN